MNRYLFVWTVILLSITTKSKCLSIDTNVVRSDNQNVAATESNIVIKLLWMFARRSLIFFYSAGRSTTNDFKYRIPLGPFTVGIESVKDSYEISLLKKDNGKLLNDWLLFFNIKYFAFRRSRRQETNAFLCTSLYGCQSGRVVPSGLQTGISFSSKSIIYGQNCLHNSSNCNIQQDNVRTAPHWVNTIFLILIFSDIWCIDMNTSDFAYRALRANFLWHLIKFHKLASAGSYKGFVFSARYGKLNKESVLSSLAIGHI